MVKAAELKAGGLLQLYVCLDLACIFIYIDSDRLKPGLSPEIMTKYIYIYICICTYICNIYTYEYVYIDIIYIHIFV